MVDTGNFSDNPTPLGDIKTKALLEGMARMGYSVVNVGERDVKMGFETFKRRTADSKLPFISANIVRASDMESVFPAHIVLDAVSPDNQARSRVGVIGVARFNPVFRKAGPDGDQIVIVHPIERIQREVKALEEKGVKTIVLLAALHKDDAGRIADEVPELDFIIGAYGGHYSRTAEQVNNARIVYSGNQGKRVGVTRVFLTLQDELAFQRTKVHFLTRTYPAQQEMLDFVNAVPIERKVSRATAPGKAIVGASFIGSAGCKSCHQAEFTQWRSTGHARAMQTLRTQGGHDDATCRGCHVTGATAADGFRDLTSTPYLAEVGCESCHGAGREHSRDPNRRLSRITVATCSGCHDIDNSPEFDYYAYLPRVIHSARASR